MLTYECETCIYHENSTENSCICKHNFGGEKYHMDDCGNHNKKKCPYWKCENAEYWGV